MSQNERKKHFYLIVFVVFALGLFLGRMSYMWSDAIPVIYKRTKTYKILQLIDLINKKYVDRVNTDSIVNVVLNDVLSELDPHSIYFTSEEYRSVDYEVEGHYKGIGITYSKYFSETPEILKVLPGSPADRAGIIPGDLFIALNGDSTAKMTTDEIMDRIRKAHRVEMSIKRLSTDTLFSVVLKKQDLNLPTVYGGLLGDSLCYMRITSFGKTTFDEFMKIGSRCSATGIKGMILDLRDNSGGMLSTSKQILEQFFPENTLLFYLKDRQKIKERFYAGKGGRFQDVPVVVLINNSTASASELIAGAIQDNDRGVIIGTRSFGKGLVQSEYRFPDGSVVRLTTSKYYTPSGRCLQRSYNTYYKQNLQQMDSLPLDTTQVFHTKNGRVIYGNGGVVPDIWIKDTLHTNISLPEIMIYQKILRLYGSQIHSLRSMSQLCYLVDTLTEGTIFSPHNYGIKYSVIDSRFGPDSAFKFFNTFSPVFNKALEVLKDSVLYHNILSGKRNF